MDTSVEADSCIHFTGLLCHSDFRYAFPDLSPRCENRFFWLFCPGYLVINEPAAQREWVNNAPNLVSWSKGLLDGIYGFDVELARMSTDGLTLVARNGQPYLFWSMD